MGLRDRVGTALKDAMRNKEAERLSTLRLINAAIKDKDIAARTEGADDAGVSDDVVLQILGKMVKQRQESARAYEEGGRVDLAERERSEIGVIEEFLPQQMSEDETRAAIEGIKAEVGAQSVKDMGRVMAVLKERHGTVIDMSKASGLVKAALG